MKVQIKPLYKDTILPYRGSEEAAGYDVYAHLQENVESVTIEPHETLLIGTGFAAAIPHGYVGLMCARSGLAIKKNSRPENSPGIIDSDYRGEFKVGLHNDGEIAQTIYHGDRIAQLVIVPYLDAEFDPVEELDETERGLGGFGSTGI